MTADLAAAKRRIAAEDERYARLFGMPGPADPPRYVVSDAPAAPPTRLTPCDHLGHNLTGPERAARDLDHRRVWSLCTHPSQPKGEAVCSCQGCGPTCQGYAPYDPPA